MPSRRGYRSGQALLLDEDLHAGDIRRSSPPVPSSARPSTGHRSGPSGGSLTTRTPPQCEQGSGTLGGGRGRPERPGRHGTGRSPRRRGRGPAPRPGRSPPEPDPPSPMAATASSSSAVRFSMASRRTSSRSGLASATTSPGIPAPEPRSTTSEPGATDESAFTKPGGVLHVGVDRAGAEDTESPGPLQHGQQGGGGAHRTAVRKRRWPRRSGAIGNERRTGPIMPGR